MSATIGGGSSPVPLTEAQIAAVALQKSQNGADIPDKAIFRGNLGGTTVGSSLFTAINAAVARTVLALGDFATKLLSDTFAFTNTTDSTSSTTGAITTSGGVGVAKNLTVGGSLKSPTNSRFNPQIQASLQTPDSIPTGTNAAITPIHTYGLLVLSSGSLGSTSVWALSYESATLIATTNATQWVASTSTPAAGKISIAYVADFGFVCFNNIGTTVSIYKILFETYRS